MIKILIALSKFLNKLGIKTCVAVNKGVKKKQLSINREVLIKGKPVRISELCLHPSVFLDNLNKEEFPIFMFRGNSEKSLSLESVVVTNKEADSRVDAFVEKVAESLNSFHPVNVFLLDSFTGEYVSVEFYYSPKLLFL